MIIWMSDTFEKGKEKERMVPKVESLEIRSPRRASILESLATARQTVGHLVEEKQILDHQSKEIPKDPERKDQRAEKEKAKEKERRAKESPSRSAMWKLKTKSQKPKAGMPAGKASNQRLKVRRIILALELLTKKTQKTTRSLMTTRKKDEEDIGIEGGEITGLQPREETELQQGEAEVS